MLLKAEEVHVWVSEGGGESSGILSSVLSAYMELPPEGIRLERGEYGKPRLPGSPLRFNLSHSGELSVVAVAWGREVGIDVEMVRTRRRWHSVASRLLGGELLSELTACASSGERDRMFLRAWCRLEAYAKALGRSVWNVGRCPEGEGEVSPGWWLVEIEPAPGYVGALVVEGPAPPVVLWYEA